jgi:hypothetical protein
MQPLSAPNKHYSALGNQMVADAVAAGLQKCNVSPDID